jgi:hypothetical protein
MRIIVILLSLATLALGGCQGNRLNGSASSTLVTTRTALT